MGLFRVPEMRSLRLSRSHAEASRLGVNARDAHFSAMVGLGFIDALDAGAYLGLIGRVELNRQDGEAGGTRRRDETAICRRVNRPTTAQQAASDGGWRLAAHFHRRDRSAATAGGGLTALFERFRSSCHRASARR